MSQRNTDGSGWSEASARLLQLVGFRGPNASPKLHGVGSMGRGSSLCSGVAEMPTNPDGNYS